MDNLRHGMYTEDVEHPKLGTQYYVYLKTDGRLAPNLEDGRISVVIYGSKDERDRFMETATDGELMLIGLSILCQWNSKELKDKQFYLRSREKAVNEIQKRAGIVDS